MFDDDDDINEEAGLNEDNSDEEEAADSSAEETPVPASPAEFESFDKKHADAPAERHCDHLPYAHAESARDHQAGRHPGGSHRRPQVF